MENEEIIFHPIGYIKSDYKTIEETPKHGFENEFLPNHAITQNNQRNVQNKCRCTDRQMKQVAQHQWNAWYSAGRKFTIFCKCRDPDRERDTADQIIVKIVKK